MHHLLEYIQGISTGEYLTAGTISYLVAATRLSIQMGWQQGKLEWKIDFKWGGSRRG